MKHLLDANTLIEAKNRYYGMTICPGYWSWLLLQNQAFELASIVSVKDELTKGKDELAEWAKDHAGLFHDISDDETQAAFGQVAAAIAELGDKMKVGALEEFLGGADPWLIANRPLKNVGEAAETRQKRPKKRSLRVVNEHFEAVFNAVSATQVVFQRPAKAMTTGATLVTHEVLNREVKRKFIIPNVCEMFGVPYMNTFALLNKLEARFVLPT